MLGVELARFVALVKRLDGSMSRGGGTKRSVSRWAGISPLTFAVAIRVNTACLTRLKTDASCFSVDDASRLALGDSFEYRATCTGRFSSTVRRNGTATKRTAIGATLFDSVGDVFDGAKSDA